MLPALKLNRITEEDTVNDTTKRSNNEPVTPEKETDSAFAAEMEELKREMRSAKIVDWAQNNQQQLIAGVVAILLMLVGGSLWLEHNKSQKNSAATLYHQALAFTDAEQKKAMLEMVIKDYGDTGYGSLAHLYMAKLSDHPEAHLNALINSAASTPELAWQARLDLAEWHLGQGNTDEVKKLLAESVGKQFEQLRHYLLAEASSDTAEKQKHLQMSLDSASNDAFLKSRVESQLSRLGGTSSGS
jgi:predicted negative regulator of RcsB-dependent stress response